MKRIKNSEREADLKTKLIAKINSFSLNLEESEEVIQYKLIQLVKGEVNQIFEEKKGHEPENGRLNIIIINYFLL